MSLPSRVTLNSTGHHSLAGIDIGTIIGSIFGAGAKASDPFTAALEADSAARANRGQLGMVLGLVGVLAVGGLVAYGIFKK